MNKEQLRKTLYELKESLAISDNIKIELTSMKTKAASISLKRNTIRLNKNIVYTLDQDCIEHLIVHELTHYKLGNTYHNREFHEQINKCIENAKSKETERKILQSLLKSNNVL